MANTQSATLLALACLAGTPLIFSQPLPPMMGHTGKLVIEQFPPRNPAPLTVTSPAFKDGGDIPLEYTQYRGNIFPGLSWTAGPAGTRSYAIFMQGEDTDGASAITSIHLSLFDVPSEVTQLGTGMAIRPAGSEFGPNVHGLNQPYAGPHTHSIAKHAYHLEVLALDTLLRLKPTVPFDELLAAIAGHVLASGEVIGFAARDPDSAPL